ncbi:2-acylglycerol O-acyltransferase 1-like isoform X2 [Odontomachus brunneus]|uniref:2-acylglycerol O-acyltransferase 1-like isoform X2 n=1 Tax=Odontomachus brunneus TaxID=486640 RepID=UPI0013F1CE82|nr:2-acylglycerol O-acyltransferase 1-like isoform X2 [Odontomachus brunneus]
MDLHNKFRPSKWTEFLRNNAFWRYFYNYFPMKLVKTVDLDPTKSYLFVCIPHGIITTGISTAFGTDILDCRKLFPGLDIRVIIHHKLFEVPVMREFLISIGCCSSSVESIRYLLSTPPESPFTGRATLLVVGGAAELFEAKPGTYRTIVKRRKGFIKLALQHGTTLVPVFTFGETDLFNQLHQKEGSFFRRFRDYIFKLKLIPTIFWGRGYFQYSFGLIPNRTPITVVVGGPIELPKIAEPTAEQINEYHEKFIQQLIKLFETHKYSYLKDPEKIVVELI